MCVYIYIINVGVWLVSWDPIVRNVCFLIEYLGVFFLGGASIVSFFSQIHFFKEEKIGLYKNKN